MMKTDANIPQDVAAILDFFEKRNFFSIKNPCQYEDPITVEQNKERGIKGFTTGDYWNVDSTLYWLVSSYCQFIDTSDAKKLYKLVRKLKRQQDSFGYPYNLKGVKKRFGDTYSLQELQNFYQEKQKTLFPNLVAEWYSLYRKVFVPNDNHGLTQNQVAIMSTRLKGYKACADNLMTVMKQNGDTDLGSEKIVIWEKVKNTIPDPVTGLTDEETRKQHAVERAVQGFSSFDVQNPSAHLAWFFTMGCLFLASDEAHGHPGTMNNFLEWQTLLFSFADAIWSDAFIPGSRNDQNVQDKLKLFPQYLGNMWD